MAKAAFVTGVCMGPLPGGGRGWRDRRRLNKGRRAVNITAIQVVAEYDTRPLRQHQSQVFAWGSPAGGRLGARPERWLLNSGRQSEPRLVRGLVGVKAWTVQCGHQHSGKARMSLHAQGMAWSSHVAAVCSQPRLQSSQRSMVGT